MNVFQGPSEPDVEVIRIPLEEAAAEPASTDLGEAGAGVSAEQTLQGFILNARVNDLLQAYRERADAAYLLSWQGGRVPRGAQVGSRVIGWTQHGMVKDREGQWVGSYERIVDNEGEPPKNEMLVFMKPEPPAQTGFE